MGQLSLFIHLIDGYTHLKNTYIEKGKMQMNDNKREFQNTYPAYRAQRLPPPPSEKLVSAEIDEPVKSFNPLLAEKIYPVRKNLFVRMNWKRSDIKVVITLMLIGILFIFPGSWTDSPAPQETAASLDMTQSGLIICIVAPLEYLLFRVYGDRGIRIIGIIGVVVASFGLCNFTGGFGDTFVDGPSSAPRTILWGLLIFGIVSFIYGTMLRLLGRLSYRQKSL